MRTIWKYKLLPKPWSEDTAEMAQGRSFEIPIGAEVISVREQGDGVVLWASVDPLAAKEMRYFVWFGTGEDVPEMNLRPLGTVMPGRGGNVLHVFEWLDRKTT